MANTPSYSLNEIHLGLGQQVGGKISGVSVYADRAEVWRSYRFNIAAGQNRAIVHGLPYTLDESSVRYVHPPRFVCSI